VDPSARYPLQGQAPPAPEPPRRVVIVVENLPVPMDRRVWMEATTLRQAGYEVNVICPTGKGCERLYEEIAGVHIYRYALPVEATSAGGYLREYATAVWSQWTLARRIFKERGFDVIHACNPPDLVFLTGWWFRLLHGTRFLFDQHDLCPELYESKYGRRGLYYWLLTAAERLTYLLATTVISTNESYKRIAISRGRKNAADVVVVRSGPDLNIFRKVPANPALRAGRRYLVGYLGVMGDVDGVDGLVRVIHELVVNRGRTDIHFCLIGGGPMLESLKALARELGVSDFVDFPGRVPDAEVLERLSTCDVCVNPDPVSPLNDKSTMNKILEYMALDRPIVQFDLREGRESAAEASLYAGADDLIDFADKVELLLADPELRAKMGAIGRRRMEDLLEWRHQVPKLLSAYDQVWAARRTRS
jgi:glycosyltransferase involved in cell wall biosynthesis